MQGTTNKPLLTGLFFDNPFDRSLDDALDQDEHQHGFGGRQKGSGNGQGNGSGTKASRYATWSPAATAGRDMAYAEALLDSSGPPPKPPRGVKRHPGPHPGPKFQSKPSRCDSIVWGLFASGFVSSLLFLIGMVVYDVSLPHTEEAYMDPESEMGVQCSWLWFFGALFFCLESGLDIAWGILIGLKAKLKLSATSTRLLDAAEGVEVFSVVGRKQHCLDMINWNLWAAILFFVPSMLYLAASLLDPNVCGSDSCGWLNIRQSIFKEDMPNDEYAYEHLDLAASILFVVDAMVALMARWRSICNTPRRDRLAFLHVWRAKTFFDVHWCAWGDVFFFIGSCYGVQAHYQYDSLVDQTLCYGLWTLDAVLYVLGSLPALWALSKTPEAPPDYQTPPQSPLVEVDLTRT